jgi:hypothetical protein
MVKTVKPGPYRGRSLLSVGAPQGSWIFSWRKWRHRPSQVARSPARHARRAAWWQEEQEVDGVVGLLLWFLICSYNLQHNIASYHSSYNSS